MLGVLAAEGSEVIGDMFENATFYARSSITGLVVLFLVAGLMLRKGINNVIVGFVSLGAFWAGWLIYGFVRHQDNPLFQGDDDAANLIKLFAQNIWFALAFVVGGGIIWLVCSQRKLSYAITGVFIICALLTTSMVGTIYGAVAG